MHERTLAELEGHDVPKPRENTYLLQTTYRLRQVPLRDFTVEDLRIMIGQNIGLQYLVPLALEHLRKNALAQGDFYPGDLLNALLAADSTFWQDHPKWREEIDQIAQRTHSV